MPPYPIGYLELSPYNTINTNYGPLAGNLFLNNYLRYLDDSFIIFDRNLLPVDDLCIIFNELNPDLNFKLETLGDEINLLDVKAKVEDCIITTNIFYKATDSKQFLKFFPVILTIQKWHSLIIYHVEYALLFRVMRLGQED